MSDTDHWPVNDPKQLAELVDRARLGRAFAMANTRRWLILSEMSPREMEEKLTRHREDQLWAIKGDAYLEGQARRIGPVNLDAPRTEDDSRRLLEHFVEQDEPEKIRVLLRHGASVKPANESVPSAIFTAISAPRPECLQVFIDARAPIKDCRYRVNGMTFDPVQWACIRGQAWAIEPLCQAGLSLDRKLKEQSRGAPAHLGANHADVLRELGRLNANLRSTDRQGNSVAHLVAQRDNTAAFMAVLDLGLRLDTRNGAGQTARQMARDNDALAPLLRSWEARQRAHSVLDELGLKGPLRP